MADSFRIAFEEQLSRNRSLASQLIKLHSPRRPRMFSVKSCLFVASLCVYVN